MSARARRAAVVRLAAIVVLVASAAVSAAWIVPTAPGAAAASAAASMPVVDPPTVVPTGADAVSVTWSAVTMPDGTAVGYRVTRAPAGGGSETEVCGSLASPLTGTSCNDVGVPNGTWVWRVQSVLATWVGAASLPSASLTVPVDQCAAPANGIVAENCLPGSPPSAWEVDGAGDPTVQGFATDISVNRGDTVSFKIDTTATAVEIGIYRLGYYDGDGARLVHTIPPAAVTATDQPACTETAIPMGGGATTSGTLLDCGNWSVSASWTVPADATSGVYIARPTRTDTGGASHIPFIVRDDASESDLLFQTSDTTWQSYNTYGGYNAYGSSGATMAEKLSYNRPFTTRGAELENYLFNAEYPMIRWLERNGYDVSYVSAVDTERHAALLLNHEVFLSVGHDEYWSQGRRDAVTAARDAGVNLAFFSGNEVYWKTRWEGSPVDGQAYRTQVVYKEGSSAPSGAAEHRNCYDNYACDPSDVWTGQWREAPGATPENSLSGQISWRLNEQSITVPGEYAPLRFWRDTDVAALGPTGTVTLAYGTLGYEWDPEYPEYADWYPAGRVPLSTTTATSFTGRPEQHHLNLYRAPSGALVFGAGTVQWSWGLDATHDRAASTEDRNVQQATVNLLADMGVRPATLQATLVAATPSSDVTPPTVAVTSPAAGTTVPGGAVTVTGTATDLGGGVVGAVEISTDGGTTWRRATGRATWSHTYSAAEGVADVRVRAVDDSVNLGPVTAHSFTVAPRVCPCSIWPDTATPATTNANDNPGVGIEVGVKLRASQDGYITGLRFYWAPGDSGTHTGNLWTAGGTLLATAAFPAASVPGWQTVALDAPVPVAAGTTYVASQHSSEGYYPYTSGYFATAFVNPPLTALADGTDGPNGVYRYGATGFPTTTYGASNYWVDVVFTTDVGPDTTPPTIVGRVPAPGATGVLATSNVTVTFGEPIDQATLTGNVELRDPTDAIVASTLGYDGPSRTVTLDPVTDLSPGATYTVVVRGGPTGVADLAGNRLAADSTTWAFTVKAGLSTRPDPNTGPGGPVLVVKGTGAFGSYLPEIMRAEGLNLFAVATTTALTASGLEPYETVVLGETTLTTEQVTALADWVTAGGDLIALRPDPQLAGLLGLVPAGGTLSEGYIAVDTTAPPGAGIVGETMQFHGTADGYTAASGTQVVATLFSSATTPTAWPAVTLRSVGVAGGSASAFTYDLARSVVLTRQGNPAWQNINGDASPGPFRADDMFHNGTDPDWVDLTKVAIPQADEQQRLLANVLTETTRDALPLPRFWYLPRGEVAALVMTADEHNGGNVPARFESEKAASPAGCSLVDWECIRSTSYLYPDYPSMTASQAAAYQAEGFEIALHPNTSCASPTRAEFTSLVTTQLAALATKYPDLEPSVTSRNHCIAWSDYTTVPEVLAEQGIHLDTNYYFWPPDWVDDTPGLFTGSGFPQRFATQGGSLVDVYQATTQMTDESGQSFPQTAIALMDRAISQGYYGTFVLNFHTDGAGNTYHDPVVQAAQQRSVPVISAEQLLTWVDGRNASSFGGLTWSGDQLEFSVAAGAGADGLQAMLPLQGPSGALETLDRGATPVPFSTMTIKGVPYAVFAAAPGTYVATYGADTTAPTITGRSPVPGATDVAITSDVTVTFSEPMLAGSISTSTVTLRARGASTDVPATVSVAGEVVTLDPTGALEIGTTYDVTVAASVADLAGNQLGTPATWSFTTTSAFTIFGETPGGSQTVDTGDYELGVKLRASVDGWVTGVRFYKPTGATGTHIGKLWTSTGQLLASATFVETASGWQEVSFAAPVAVTANTTYVASYSWPGGYYPYQAGAFLAAGVTSGPLTALQSGVDGPNGVFNEAPGTFPQTGNGANYFADVVFVTDIDDTTAPTVVGRSPSPDAVDVAVATDVTVTFSEPMLASSIGATTVTLRAQGASTDVAATVGVDGPVVTLDPTANLEPETQYTATIAGSVSDLAGNQLGADVVWTFTTAAPPSYACPCSIWEAPLPIPGNPAVTDNQPIEVGVKLRSEVDGWITGVRFYKGTANTGTHVGHLWSATGDLLAEATFTAETASGWQQVDFATPVLVTAGTTYVASYYSSSGYFAIDAGFFTSTAVVNPPLTALQAGTDGPNGVYKYGGGFPNGGNTANYWVDVVFVTDLPATPTTLVDDTLADFAAGTTTDTYLSDAAGGEVILTPALAAEWDGTTLPSGWSAKASPWTAGGAAVVGGGTLGVDGTMVGTTSTFGPGLAVDFVATFAAQRFQHVGFVGNLDFTGSWAIVSTGSAGDNVYARTSDGAQVALGADLLGGPHRYRIEWTPTGFVFSVDGTVRTTIPFATTGPMLVGVSDIDSGLPVVVDSLRLSPYPASGTFTSRVLDATAPGTVGSVAWTAATPASTGVSMQVRGSDDGTAWGPWIDVPASGGPPASAVTGRYFQYQAVLSSADPVVTPILERVTITVV